MAQSLANRILVLSCTVKFTPVTDNAYTTVRRLADAYPDFSEGQFIERYLHISGAQWVRPQDCECELLPNGMELLDDDALPDGMIYDPDPGYVLVAVPRNLEYLVLEAFESIWDAYSESDLHDTYCSNDPVFRATVKTYESPGITHHHLDDAA